MDRPRRMLMRPKWDGGDGTATITAPVDGQLASQYWDGSTQQQARLSRIAGMGGEIGPPAINIPPDVAARGGLGTVRREWPWTGYPLSATTIYTMARAGDDIPAWGTAPRARDVMLRNFWPTEPFLASTVYAVAGRYTGLKWTIDGPDDIADDIQTMLNGVEHGKGWSRWLFPYVIDMLTQDNGGWAEIVRAEDDPLAPCITLNHLDSSRCVRTGRWDEPIIYIDVRGVHHRMKWYQCMELVEMPSPIENARGLQYCALTRTLRASQIARDYGIYTQEKVSGRFNKQIHLVSGIQSKVITSALEQHRQKADEQSLSRYIQPAVIASLDPNAKVSVATLDLAGLPDGFDQRESMVWYITNLALGFGGDYQDLAPLQSRGGMGSAQGAEILQLKSRGKGVALFMTNMEQNMNYHGIMPKLARFDYDEADNVEALEEIELDTEFAKKQQVQIMSGLMSTQAARNEAIAKGFIDEDWLTDDEPMEAPGAFPGGPMKQPDGTTVQPESKPIKDSVSPGGQNPVRKIRTARGEGGQNKALEAVEQLVDEHETLRESEDMMAHAFKSLAEREPTAPVVNVEAPVVNVPAPIVHVRVPTINIPEAPTPQVNVTTDSTDVLAAIKELSESLKRPVRTHKEVKRAPSGEISEVIETTEGR